MDLEAQENGNGKVNCPACQALNASGAKVCLVCGAALGGVGDATDSALYQDLARANLMRMRGQSKEASALCLSILRKAPNHVAAHSLLGDIYYDQDDLRQAAEWYELASQLDATAVRERQLLERIRGRMSEQDHLQTLQQLGVAQNGPPVMRYVAGGIALIVLVGAAGYFVGNSLSKKGELPKPIQNPITVGQPVDSSGSEPGVDGSAAWGSVAGVGIVAGDEAILNLLKGTGDKAFFISAVEVPNRGQIVVTAHVGDQNSAPVTALLLVGDVFVQKPEAKSVVMRLVKDGAVVFSGEVTREAYDEAQGSSSQDGADLESISAQAFPNPFYPGAPSNVTTGPGSTPATGRADGTVPKSSDGGGD